jgi:hypothetical protein
LARIKGFRNIATAVLPVETVLALHDLLLKLLFI